MEIRTHATKKWVVSMIEFQRNGTLAIKVTRHLPHLAVTETKVFNDRKKAKEQFEDWLQ